VAIKGVFKKNLEEHIMVNSRDEEIWISQWDSECLFEEGVGLYALCTDQWIWQSEKSGGLNWGSSFVPIFTIWLKGMWQVSEGRWYY